MAELDPRYTDKRTIDRYIKTGMIDEKEYEKHVKNLPDVAEKGMAVESVLDDDIDDEDDIEE
jgi:hypothetical protein